MRTIHVSLIAVLVLTCVRAGAQTPQPGQPQKEIELVGPLPAELRAWLDLSFAVSARALHREGSLMLYLLRPESKTVWKPRGLERFE